jgi:hypothetical protein
MTRAKADAEGDLKMMHMNIGITTQKIGKGE